MAKVALQQVQMPTTHYDEVVRKSKKNTAKLAAISHKPVSSRRKGILTISLEVEFLPSWMAQVPVDTNSALVAGLVEASEPFMGLAIKGATLDMVREVPIKR